MDFRVISSVELRDLMNNWIEGNSRGKSKEDLWSNWVLGMHSRDEGYTGEGITVVQNVKCERSQGTSRGCCWKGQVWQQGRDLDWREKLGPNFYYIFLCHLDLLRGECIHVFQEGRGVAACK